MNQILPRDSLNGEDQSCPLGLPSAFLKEMDIGGKNIIEFFQSLLHKDVLTLNAGSRTLVKK